MPRFIEIPSLSGERSHHEEEVLITDVHRTDGRMADHNTQASRQLSLQAAAVAKNESVCMSMSLTSHYESIC